MSVVDGLDCVCCAESVGRCILNWNARSWSYDGRAGFFVVLFVPDYTAGSIREMYCAGAMLGSGNHALCCAAMKWKSLSNQGTTGLNSSHHFVLKWLEPSWFEE